MARELWRRLVDTIAGGMRQRVTRAGVGFSLLVSIVGALAFLSGNNVLFLLLGCLLATLLVSGFLSRLSLAGLELDLQFPEHVSARRKLPALVKLKNDKSWLPSMAIHLEGMPGSVVFSRLYFPALPGGAAVQEIVDVEFERRGQHRQNSFRLRSVFPFGLTERHVQVTLRCEALVYPCLVPQPGFAPLLERLQGDISAHVRGRGNDFYRIRPYLSGESARHLDWKATAHTGELQVREFARDRDPTVEIFLDLDAGFELRAWFERAVDCAAYLSWHAAQSGARLHFRTQAFEFESPAEGDVYVILRFLALVEPRRGRNLPAPARADNIHVVLTPSAERVAQAGWHRALVVDAAALEPATSASPGSGRGATRTRR
ncbi:MAG: DUF58 domain-containing protein [Acidobacteria bacterium]|nr:DUF58 domain-containing protein [Acidobacteriota bacterium]